MAKKKQKTGSPKMAEHVEFDIKAEKIEGLKIRLVGEVYTLYPPKVALGMDMALNAENFEKDPRAAADAIDRWLAEAFEPDDLKKIRKRLAQPPREDLLDFPHIVTLIEKTTEAQTGNPTS